MRHARTHAAHKGYPPATANLRLIASTGPRNTSIDSQTAADFGIAVTATGYDSTPTIEFSWSLILASRRGIDREAACSILYRSSFRDGSNSLSAIIRR
jgi:hypothetical protein